MTALKRTRGTKPIDISGWTFNLGELDKPIGRAISNTLRHVLTYDDDASIDAFWPHKSDFLRIAIGLPFCRRHDDRVEFEFSLLDLVKEADIQPEQAASARDSFLRLAAYIHRQHIKAERMPTIDDVVLHQNIEVADSDLWTWVSHLPKADVIKWLKSNIIDTDNSISVLRHNKVQLEAALVHVEALPD